MGTNTINGVAIQDWCLHTGTIIAQIHCPWPGLARITCLALTRPPHSGSYVMGFVLADTKGWLDTPGTPPFEVVPLQTFDKLREAVNDGTAHFFMWEYFTSKKYYDDGAIKQIGEIYTPWSSWKIVAADPEDDRLSGMFESIDKGVAYFNAHQEEAVEYISTSLDYSAADARAWLGTVKFAEGVRGVSAATIGNTIEVLRKAGVIEGRDVRADSMIGVKRLE